MPAPQNEPHTSDTEGAERPLRERLRNTSIAGRGALPPKSITTESEPLPTITSEPEKDSAKLRGRPQRKRSHDDIEDAAEEEPAHKSRHGRKRSRESTYEGLAQEQPGKRKSAELERTNEPETTNGTDENAPPTTETSVSPVAVDVEQTKHAESPKTKRNKVSDKEDANPTVESDAKPTIEIQEKESITAPKIPAGSGFANTSAASPFAALANNSKSPSEQPQPSSSAFASSAFGALASSSTSGFGALAQTKTLSSFASPSPTATPAPADESAKPETKSAFGGTSAFSASPFAAAGSSAFGSSGSGFGSGGSGFGSGGSGFGTLGNGLGGGFGGGFGGSKLTTFASSGTPGVIGSSKTSIKPFGVAEDDEEDKSGDEDGEGAGIKSPKPAEEEDKDERFFAQDIETGEENESTEYTCRAKLYNFVDKKEWKERGLGVLRLNVLNPKSGDASTAPKARLVMRSDGSHRVILNTPIQKGINFGSVTGEPPAGGYIYFMGSIDGQPKLELLQLKVRQQFALELYEHIAELQKQM